MNGLVRLGPTPIEHMQARYYDPLAGRFLSSDPVGVAEGGPAYFNRYAYVAGDPVNAIDSTGTEIDEIVVRATRPKEHFSPTPAGGGFASRARAEGPAFLGGFRSVTSAFANRDKSRKKNKKKKSKDPCDRLIQRVGNAVEAAGEGIIYDGAAIAVLGAGAGSALPAVGTAAGASPGIAIAGVFGGPIASLGQLLQDINHGNGFREIAGRATGNILAGRAGTLALRNVRGPIPNGRFEKFFTNTTVGSGISSTVEFLDPERC